MPDLKNVSYIHATFHTTENVTDEDRRYFGKGRIDSLLPYMSKDNYGRDRSLTEYKAAVLENDILKATFLPEVGGRLWSLIHKPTGRELLYKNEIVQPCNLGLRNAWVAGGIEWNVGIKGHTPFTCDPLFVAESRNDKGEPILSMYEYERIRGTVFGINAYLEGESLYVRTTVENTADTETYTYWWSNIAVPEEGTRVLTDAEEMFTCLYGNNHYTIDKIPAPNYKGIDLSYPERAPHAGDLFFVTNDERRKWIAALDKDGFGLLQYSTPELKGRKLFFWGQGQGGRNWNRFLSESNRPYVEIQAGLLRTQMEHVPLPPQTTLSWTECYRAFSADPTVFSGEWQNACRAVAETVATLPDPAEANIPLTAEKELRAFGAGWGASENRAVSRYYPFPSESITEKEAPWQQLFQGNALPEVSVETAPQSYYVSPRALALLEQSATTAKGNRWNTFLHIGINRYALGDIRGAKDAWETSVTLEKNLWAYRNLSVLYKNDFSDNKASVLAMEEALSLMKTPFRPLLADAAKVFTDCGEYRRWLEIFQALPAPLNKDGRLRFYGALAYLRTGRTEEAKNILNETFTMSDIKEGELSVTALWKELYGTLTTLPPHLDFRMHE